MSNLAERRGTAAIFLLAFVPVAAASHLGLGEPPRPPEIHIRLVDFAGIPEKVRTQAEAVVVTIFRRAGLELDFVECLSADAQPCRQPPSEADFWLQILNQRPKNPIRDAAGFAVLVRSHRPGDSYAAVSYPMVQSAALELDAPVAAVLAATMAHEIGHLLLNSSAHSRTGVMSPRLDRPRILLFESGELLFTRDEVARLSQRATRSAP
jgi:hypothetical protein